MAESELGKSANKVVDAIEKAIFAVKQVIVDSKDAAKELQAQLDKKDNK
ncbi:MAG: hypothetical protein Q8P59_01900 [Dehalococcoidia bacterium]|nr:hypothetical protein [Dehalococcoidia bacterium]